MKAVFQSFLLMLASATDRALAKQVQFLKVENQILRGRLPKRITVTPQERRRLIKYGRPPGKAIKDLISIVSPRTFLRWLGAEQPSAPKPLKSGRPRTEAEIRDLVLKLARETGWGYTRILGELKKLGVRRICRSTVINILKEHGLDPGPQRGADSWDAFLKRHAATLWACDFFSKKVWTKAGLVEFYVLFFINIGTRRVYVSGLSAQPDRAWMVQQARNAAMHFAEQPAKPALLLCDHDTKFVRQFDELLEAEGVAVKRVGPRAPNLNATPNGGCNRLSKNVWTALSSLARPTCGT